MMSKPLANPGHSRRAFLKTSASAAGALALGDYCWPALAETGAASAGMLVANLPKGAAPKPVSFPHFPSRLHAFVWRNWPLVTPERMAQVVGTKPANIVRLGRAMGLGDPPPITRDQQARSYVTVIKRNWHLLPYEQLLQLLGWSVDKLDFTLREEDFLYVKLGQLKPQCDPLRYQPSDDSTRKRERELAAIVREEFPKDAARGEDPLFSFVAALSRKPEAVAGPGVKLPPNLRFCYSYFALCGDPLLDARVDPYPDGFLARLAQTGVNGVWLQSVLYKIAPFPWAPGLSAQYETRLNHLRALVARARRHGIQVFLYLNEPRAMPLSFFEQHPQLKGGIEGNYAALCTSVPEVQRYLVAAVASVCRAVPDLGGFFSITFSENFTHCWSHNNEGAKCPRCAKRPPGDVVAELNPLFAEGIRQAGTGARLIAWDWVWADDWAPEVIRRLPAEAELMSVSEWSLPIERGGVKSEVGEYSISAVGPGPRARRHWKLARERGLKTLAKIQAGNTWELSAVPYIPAVQNVARHAENLRGENVNGLMLGWTLGGCPSPNLEVVAEVQAGATADEAMERVAERRFGAAQAPAVVAAWREFSTAFSEFPYHISVLYNGPQQLGPANLLWHEPTGYSATMVGFPYDDLVGWRSIYLDTGRTIYSPEIFIGQFAKVADGFQRALDQLKAAAAQTAAGTSAQRRALGEECGVAEACAIHFRSCANQARFIMARQAAATAGTAEAAAPQRAAMTEVLKQEIELARRLRAIQSRDSRIGFEASNQYNYVPVDLMEKVLNCRHLLANLAK